MAGLRRLAKMFGGLTAISTNPVTGEVTKVEHVWDYVADEPTTSDEMPVGSERWKASERVKWANVGGGEDKLI
jgi:hypothetical protein